MRHEFEAKFASVSVDAVRAAEGFIGVEIFRPSQWDPEEYLMISRWRDEAALERFAGRDWSQAFIPPGMDQFVAQCAVHHYKGWDDA